MNGHHAVKSNAEGKDDMTRCLNKDNETATATVASTTQSEPCHAYYAYIKIIFIHRRLHLCQQPYWPRANFVRTTTLILGHQKPRAFKIDPVEFGASLTPCRGMSKISQSCSC